MVIKANTLQPKQSYSLRVYIDCPTCAESYADYDFLTNAPPIAGSCSSSPEQGTYTVHCENNL